MGFSHKGRVHTKSPGGQRGWDTKRSVTQEWLS